MAIEAERLHVEAMVEISEEAVAIMEKTIRNARKDYALIEQHFPGELDSFDFKDRFLFKQMVVAQCVLEQDLKACWARRVEIWNQLMEANAGRKRNWDALQEHRQLVRQQREEISALKKQIEALKKE